MPSVKPYQFAGIPRFTKQQVALYESLARYLSYRPFAANFRDGLEDVLSQSINVPTRLGQVAIHPVKREDVPQLVPAKGCFAVVSMAPGPNRVIIDIDPVTAASIVDRLLGGPGGVNGVQRAFTDIETGVLSYIFLRVLAHFHTGWQSGKEMALALDRFCGTWEELKAFIDAESYHVVGTNISLGKSSGYVRVLLPDGLVEKRFSAAPPQSGHTPQELAYMRKRFESIGEKQVTAYCIAAKLQLTPDDIANVEPGDIIVLENHQLKKTPNGIEGDIFVRIGAGRNGGFNGRLHNETDQCRLEVLNIVTQEQPLEEPMADANAPQDNLPETEGLLRDVDASVAIELGRIRMNTAQVMRLRQGQILRLPRGANDPVDLVVNGKLFARGELIEVDGELGVRLIHVAGPE